MDKFQEKGKCFCGSGKKQKKCHSTVLSKSKLASIYIDYKSYDEKVTKEQINAQCENGCSKCCSHFFFVDELEFLVIVDYILREQGKEKLDYYLSEAIEYHKFVGKHHPEIIEDYKRKMLRNANFMEEKFLNDDYYFEPSRECIFLHEGRCSVYKVRPSVCRIYGVGQYCEFTKSKKTYSFEEEEKMIVNTSILYGNDARVLVQRPFPIYYFFIVSLANEKAKAHTLKKLDAFRTLSEAEYCEYKERVNTIKE